MADVGNSGLTSTGVATGGDVTFVISIDIGGVVFDIGGAAVDTNTLIEFAQLRHYEGISGGNARLHRFSASPWANVTLDVKTWSRVNLGKAASVGQSQTLALRKRAQARRRCYVRPSMGGK